MYPEDQRSQYNIRHMTIAQWFDSEPMRQARMMMFDQKKSKVCIRCHDEENHCGTSRRHRANQKSVIFTRENFRDSYEQSPHFGHFNDSLKSGGVYPGLPLDVHIDLGNYCNLTCKMCRPQASSSIADQYRRWGIPGADRYIGTDWTRDSDTWHRVMNELSSIADLRNVHFMGGETLITPKFEQFVDHMIAQGRQDLSFSFVTNGTQFRPSLLQKLKNFRRVGIEVSIETMTEHNAYQRQGTDNQQVLANINRYLDYCDGDQFTLTLRPAVSLLTVGHYHTLLQFALDRNILIKSLIAIRPEYLSVPILPQAVKQQYLETYRDFMERNNLDQENCDQDYNYSDPHEIRRVIKSQVIMCRNLLLTDRPQDSDRLLAEMVHWCRRWDQVHGYDALALYPELRHIFVTHGYPST